MATWTLQSSSDDSATINDAVSVWSETLGLYVVLMSDSGQPDLCLTSPDAAAWTGHGNPFGTGEPEGFYGALALDDSAPLIVAAVRHTPKQGVYKSSDGSTFTHPTNGFDTKQNASGVCFAESIPLWVAGGSGASPNSPLIITSTDASTWASQATPWDGQTFKGVNGIGWSPDLGMLIASGDSGGVGLSCAMRSTDSGVTWTDTPTVPSWDSAGLVYQVIWSPTFSCFIAAGADANNTHTLMTSVDGTTWANVSNDPFFIGNTGGSECFAVIDTGTAVWVGGSTYHGGSSFIGPTVFSTTDLSTWTDEGCPFDAQVMSLAYKASTQQVVAIGLNSTPGQVEIIASAEAAAPVTQYQRVYGWRASIDDNALETVEVLTSPQGFS